MTGLRPTLPETLTYPLDAKSLEERLFRIELVLRSEFDSDKDAFEHIKAMIFRLRLDIARAAAQG